MTLNPNMAALTVAQLPPAPVVPPGTMLWCSDCLTPAGTGGVIVSDGSTWTLARWGIVATTDPLTYCRSRATCGIMRIETSAERSLATLANYSSADTASGAAFYCTANTTGAASSGYTEFYGVQLSTSSSASGYGVVASSSRTPRATLANMPIVYGSATISLRSGASDQSTPEVYWVAAGLGIIASSSTIDTEFAGLCYDRGNAWGSNSGNSANWCLFARAGGSNSGFADTSVLPLFSTTLQQLEWLYSASALKLYIAGNLVGTLSSGLPTAAIHPYSLRIGKTVGTTSRVLEVQRCASIVRY